VGGQNGVAQNGQGNTSINDNNSCQMSR